MATDPAAARRRPRGLLAAMAMALALVALLAGGCAGTAEPPAAAAPPATIAATPADPGEPGHLIAATPIDAPQGQRAWRISYHPRDGNDRPIAVTGLLVAPADAPPGLPIITYGHPTTGSADTCVPSQKGLES